MSVYSEEELKQLEALDKLSEQPSKEMNPLPEKGGDSSFSEKEELPDIDDNDWAVNLGFPPEIISFITKNNFTKVDIASLNVDLKNHLAVYQALIETKQKAFSVYEGISKDEFLRNHALETLVNGYSELQGLFNDLKTETIAYHKQLSSLDSLLSNHVEDKKIELEESVNKLQTQVETINAMALNTVAGAMKDQVTVFNETLTKENESRAEFFNLEYSKLKTGIDEAVKNSNLKNIMNKQVLIIFFCMIFSQAIITSLLFFFLK